MLHICPRVCALWWRERPLGVEDSHRTLTRSPGNCTDSWLRTVYLLFI